MLKMSVIENFKYLINIFGNDLAMLLLIGLYAAEYVKRLKFVCPSFIAA